MTRERIYLYDTTLRCPFDRSREAGEDEQTRKSVAQHEAPR
jgi:hypothetical protein